MLAPLIREVWERLVQLSKNLQLSFDRMRNDGIAGQWSQGSLGVYSNMTPAKILGRMSAFCMHEP